MSLDGFEAISFGNSGITASITKNGTTFNKATVEKLGHPNNVVLMINREAKQFAIRPATIKDTISMPFCAGERQSPSVRWNSKEFLRLITDLTGWDLKNSSGFRITGSYLSSEKAIVFDLLTAVSN